VGVSEQIGASRLEAFRAIAENSTDLILRFDRQLRHVYVNPAAERRMRRPRHLVRGKTQREVGIAEGSARVWEAELERVFRTGRERRFEFALGSGWVDAHEHFEALAIPETGARGELETVLVVVRDVTERARAHDELVEREAVLARAQRLAGLGSFSWEPEADRLRCSDELLRLVGGEEPRTLAQLVLRVHADDRLRVRRTLDEAALSGRAWSMQFRLFDRDAVERVLRSRGEVVAGLLYGTAHDVTAQEDVHATVRQLLRFSQFVVEHLDDAVVWIDGGGRIVSANRAAADRFGARSEPLVGQEVDAVGLRLPRWEELRQHGRSAYAVTPPGGSPLAVTAHHALFNGDEYACLIVSREREVAAAAPDPAVSHLLGDGELEIRGVGPLRALLAGA
jgi:PAS domain S-box-containing protein